MTRRPGRPARRGGLPAFVCILNCFAAFGANADIIEFTEGAAEPSQPIPFDARGDLDAFELRNAAIAGFDTLVPDAKGRVSYRLTGVLTRSAERSTALLVELDAADDLRQVALRRGVDVLAIVQIAPAQPDALRHAALRDIVAHLRRAGGGRSAYVLARGSGERGRALRFFAQPRHNRDGAGKTFDGLLLHDARENESSAVSAKSETRDAPLVISTWSSGFFWRDEHKSPIGADGPIARNYFLAGTPAADAASSASFECAAPINPRSIAPAARALFVALDEWTRRGVAPPASRMPNAKDHSLVARRDFRWPKLPALPTPPDGERQVPAVDVDGDETSGLRLPDQALPLGTFTGWNLRKGEPKSVCGGHGAYLPFAASKAERERNGDPRLSLQERYGLRDYYVATVRVLADRLVKERLLLPEDADAYVAAAKKAGF